MREFFQYEPLLVVAAHPDDETIGLGGHLSVLRDTYIIHVTDGAPGSTPAREHYAATRRRELRAAMNLVGISQSRCLELGAVDQESSFQLSQLSIALGEYITEVRPKLIFTHPYEGGHPDHDACAFIVQAAVILIGPDIHRPLRAEFASYHNGTPDRESSRIETGKFLPGPPVTAVTLSPEAQELKRRMFACFTTQQGVLRDFAIGEESFRAAPLYDFSMPPHAGNLFYEDKSWGVSCGIEWRRLALEAAETLGLRSAANAFER